MNNLEMLIGGCFSFDLELSLESYDWEKVKMLGLVYMKRPLVVKATSINA